MLWRWCKKWSVSRVRAAGTFFDGLATIGSPAKGTLLLGVKVVIAESYERIHRSNLVGMGVLPLQFEEGESPASLGLDGTEIYDITGVADGLVPGELVTVTAHRADGSKTVFRAVVRLDSEVDVEYFANGGILHAVLRKMARGEM